ncbi:MAG: transketolase [Candidatus Aminicenantales bacterium]
MNREEALQKIARRLRIHSVRMTTEAGSGHPTTCLSCAEIMACLFFEVMRFNPENPYDLANDEFVLSKGHAAPILWAAYAEAGIISFEELMNLRKITSNLEGHPTPRMEWVKAATGSLGQGLSVGAGIALAQRMSGSPGRTFVLMGDGECAEGAVWEAAAIASHYRLKNLTAVIDLNRLSQSQETMHGYDVAAYARKFKAFGWKTETVNGHDVTSILRAFDRVEDNEQPSVIVAKTIKGKGVSFVENKNGWHGKPFLGDNGKKALEELGPMPDIEARIYVRKPERKMNIRLNKMYNFKKNTYQKPVATRRAYGNALVNLGKVNDAVVALDGDVKNSTYAEDFFKEFPERSFQLYIAEQNMVGMAMGLAAKGYIPFVATFAAFLTRAHDQIRMAGYSFSNIKFCGSHVGVSIGADGPSQMGLEDLGLFRPIPGCAVLYPSDACAAEGCVETLACYRGMGYIRTTRPATPLIYSPLEKFPLGGSKVLRKSRSDEAAVIAAGITVHEALTAYEKLREEGINIRVIDAYSVQPIDRETVEKAARETGKRMVVVEDHFEHGGLGDAVSKVLGGAEMVHLCIKELPRSGKPEELMRKYGIDSYSIIKAVKKLIKK